VRTVATRVIRRNINKLSSDHLDKWAKKHTTGIFKSEKLGGADFETIDIFELVKMRKKIVAALDAKGLDVFKRGKKEPERIREALATLTLEKVEATPESERARSPIFD